jgi:HPt (histidine-containing phosphotransfer) domain-containing protein
MDDLFIGQYTGNITKEVEMAGVIYVNADEGIKRVMNNAGLYKTLLAKFKAGTNLDELLALLNAGDYEKARTAAHAIKGVAANLSLTELFARILELETQIKAGSVQPEQIEQVKAAFDGTIKDIDKVVEQNA